VHGEQSNAIGTLLDHGSFGGFVAFGSGRKVAALGLRERAMVFLDMPAGLRRGELAGLEWEDFDFSKLHVSVTRSLVDQHVGPVKTEASKKLMPMDEYVARDLLAWYEVTPHKTRLDSVPEAG